MKALRVANFHQMKKKVREKKLRKKLKKSLNLWVLKKKKSNQ